MKVSRLKEILSNIDDDKEIFIRNSFNICGNISELSQVEQTFYGFFGDCIPCLVFNAESSKELESNSNNDIIDLLQTDRRGIKISSSK
jgi:hypothetical protein